ncbi:hypothetical protein ACQEVF_59335 [Nonomuraea polychroma]|uniref:hypothetical protein n=1 Tax=Nonomuraea polychroma TaxID=46176 RepID=UPI003D938638
MQTKLDVSDLADPLTRLRDWDLNYYLADVRRRHGQMSYPDRTTLMLARDDVPRLLRLVNALLVDHQLDADAIADALQPAAPPPAPDDPCRTCGRDADGWLWQPDEQVWVRTCTRHRFRPWPGYQLWWAPDQDAAAGC